MAEFQLLKGAKAVGKRFTSDVDPYDPDACTELLRSLAAAHKIPTGKALLIAYQRGRKVREYRAT